MHASDFSRRPSRSRRVPLAAVAATSLLWGAGAVAPAWGATYNWTGTGTGTVESPASGQFDEATELVWDTTGAGEPELSEPFTGTDPINSTDRVLTFRQPATAAAAVTATNNIAGLNVHRMTFDVASANFGNVSAITLTQGGAGTLVFSPNGAVQPEIVYNGAGSGNVSIHANITLNSGTTLTYTGNGAGVLFMQNVAGTTSGAGGITVATNSGTPIPAGGGTTVAFGASNTFTGDFTLTSGEVVPLINSTGTTGTAGPFGRGTVNLNGGVVRAPASTARTVSNAVRIGGNPTFGTTDSPNAVIFSGPTTLVGTAGTQRTLTAQGMAATPAEFSGAIGDGGAGVGIIKSGPNALLLSGSNTYGGTTTINQGLLRINGTTSGQGNFVVNTNATAPGSLGGGGNIGLAADASVIVNSGGSINPGMVSTATPPASSDVLTVTGTVAPGGAGTATVDFAPGGIFTTDLNGTTVDTLYDRLSVNGNVDVAGGTYNPRVGYAATIGDTFFVLVNDGSEVIGGEFANAPEGGTVTSQFNGRAYELTVTYDADAEAAAFTGGNDMAVRVVSVVPEPGSLGILAIGLGLLARRRRVAR